MGEYPGIIKSLQEEIERLKQTTPLVSIDDLKPLTSPLLAAYRKLYSKQLDQLSIYMELDSITSILEILNTQSKKCGATLFHSNVDLILSNVIDNCHVCKKGLKGRFRKQH